MRGLELNKGVVQLFASVTLARGTFGITREAKIDPGSNATLIGAGHIQSLGYSLKDMAQCSTTNPSQVDGSTFPAFMFPAREIKFVDLDVIIPFVYVPYYLEEKGDKKVIRFTKSYKLLIGTDILKSLDYSVRYDKVSRRDYFEFEPSQRPVVLTKFKGEKLGGEVVLEDEDKSVTYMSAF